MGAVCCGSKASKATTIECQNETMALKRNKQGAGANPKMLNSKLMSYHDDGAVEEQKPVPANDRPVRPPKQSPQKPKAKQQPSIGNNDGD